MATHEELETDPCYRVLREHLPKSDPRSVLIDFWAELELQYRLKDMRQFLHMRPKGQPGRPRGSSRKLHPEAIPLWKQGVSKLGICVRLKVPYQERKAFKNRLKAAIRRLPEVERLAGEAAQKQAIRQTRKAIRPPRT